MQHLSILQKLLLLSLVALIAVPSFSQNVNGTPEFVTMMRNRANFNDTKKSFNNFDQQQNAQGRLSKKGYINGFKQYKRWEYWWEPRTYPSGNFPEQGIELREFRKFQQKTKAGSTGNQGNWVALGPNNWTNITGHWNPGIGRINTIVISPKDPNTIFLGTPAGGLWKTSNGGRKWTCLTDQIPTMGVSAIALNPHNPREILIGTGDRDNSNTFGVGILKTTDGGITWNTTSVNWPIIFGHTCARMVVNPVRPNIVYAATTDGLFKSTNFGSTWTRILSGDIDDIELKPNDPNTIYAVGFNSSFQYSLFISTNAGTSFTEPGINSNWRVQIAVTPVAPSNVYFFSFQGMYVSTNSGVSFERRGNAPTPGIQDWYDLAIAVSPKNPNEIHVGEIETYRSINGGSTWVQTSIWSWPNTIGYVHADIHDMVYSGSNLYVASDGLITKSTDRGESWTDLSPGLSIQQFYNIGNSSTDARKYGGGTQDNGTNIHTLNRGGWHGWLGGDGFETIITPDNQVVYGSIYFGQYYKSTNGGENIVLISGPGPGLWNSPLVIHPTDPNTLFCGLLDGVYKTTNGMESWTNTGSFGVIDDLAIASCNPRYLYAASMGDMWVSKDGGKNWKDVSTGLPDNYIKDIAIDPSNAERVAITFATYEEGIKVYTTQNAGKTWVNISFNLPNLPATAAVFHRGHGLYVGMDVGVYYLPNGSKKWQGYYKGLANAPVTELEIQYQAGKLRAGTYGRGMWETTLCTGSLNNARQEISEKAEDAGTNVATGIYPNPVSDYLNVSYDSPDNLGTTIKIIDVNGRVLITRKIDSKKGNNVISIPVQELNTGVYFLTIDNGKMKETRRFFVN